MFTLEELESSDNITELFDNLDDGDTYLSNMGQSVVNGYEIDERSRFEWKQTVDKAMDIAKQVMDEKNFPWPKASNIKFPLICEAAVDFASRIMPEIIPNDKIVQVSTQGKDPDEGIYNRGERVANCISYQCLSSPDWQDDVDKLLQILPVVGTVFKKTYYSIIEKRIISEVCSPDKIVVNYDSKSLETARRVTHLIKLSINDIITRQRKNLYNKNVDVDFLRPEGLDPNDDDFEIELLEQHCWWDLDGDDYREPYIITVHKASGKVLRIVSRFKNIEKNKDGEVVSISAEQFFTDYHFIRSPDGGFYSMGFGQLLLPINRAINSLINQLIDAGTLSVTQGGFLGKGLRMRDAEYKFRPFEWKVLDAAAGTDISKNVFPFPVREPSSTLFSLLSLMIQIGKDLTSSTEAINGNLTGSNVSDKTMNTLVEQGSKIFVAIYKRFLRSATKEYQKMYCLNYYHLTNKEYQNILNDPEANVKSDFNLDSNDVRPVADPMFSSMGQRISKVNILMGLRTADPRAVDAYALKTLQFDDTLIEELLPPPDPNQPPAPKDQKDLADAQASIAKAEQLKLETQILMNKAPLDIQATAKQAEVLDAQIQESVARVWKMQKDAVHGDQKILIAGGKMQQQEGLKQTMAQHSQSKDAADLIMKNKELDLKAAEVATKATLEKQKIEQMRKKEERDEDGNGSE